MEVEYNSKSAHIQSGVRTLVIHAQGLPQESFMDIGDGYRRLCYNEMQSRTQTNKTN